MGVFAMSDLREYIAKHIIKDENNAIPKSLLYEHYKKAMSKNKKQVLFPSKFFQYLSELVPLEDLGIQNVGGQQVRLIQGIYLKYTNINIQRKIEMTPLIQEVAELKMRLLSLESKVDERLPSWSRLSDLAWECGKSQEEIKDHLLANYQKDIDYRFYFGKIQVSNETYVKVKRAL
jgi:hypothetical protein